MSLFRLMTVRLTHPSGLGRETVGSAGAVLLALLLGGCGKPAEKAAAPDPNVVAEVGSRQITLDDVKSEATRRSGGRRGLPEKQELVQGLVRREALLQRAQEAGLDRDPAVKWEMENVMIRRLLAAELDPRREAVTVSTNDVQAEYGSHPERYARPAQSRFAMLFRAVNPKASPETRASVRAVLEAARTRAVAAAMPQPPLPGTPPGFGTLAAEVSEDQVSRYRSGDLGWFGPDHGPARVPAQVYAAAWKLEEKAISEVLEAPEGFYVFIKTESRGPTQTSFATVEPSLRQSVLVRKRKETEESFYGEIARRFPARIHTNVLESLTLPESKSALTASNRHSQPPVLPGTTETSHGH